MGEKLINEMETKMKDMEKNPNTLSDVQVQTDIIRDFRKVLEHVKGYAAKTDRLMDAWFTHNNMVNALEMKRNNGLLPNNTPVFSTNKKAANFVKYLGEIAANPNYRRKAVHGINEGVDAEGKYALIDEYSTDILRIIPKISRVRQYIKVVPLSTLVHHWRTITNNLTANWIAEGGVMQPQKPEWGTMSVSPAKMYLFIPYSSEWAQDTFVSNIGNYLGMLVAEAFAKEEERIIHFGDIVGNGDPFDGVMVDANVNEYTLGAGNTLFTHITFEDLLRLTEEVVDDVYEEGRFIMHRTMLNILQAITDTPGQYIFRNPADGGISGTMWGYPYTLHNQYPTRSDSAADTAALAYCAWQYVVLGEAGGLRVDVSEHHYFDTDETVIRYTRREGLMKVFPDKTMARLVTAAA